MKQFVAALIISLMVAPAFAAADSTYGVEPTLGQLLTRIAALQSILKGMPIGCAVTATKTTVYAGEPFTIAWGSYGADPKYSSDPQNVYAINGEQSMRLDTPQVRTYHFTFFGENGTKVTCDQTVSVLSR